MHLQNPLEILHEPEALHNIASSLTFPFWDEVTKLMSFLRNLNLNCEHQAEIVSYHAITRTSWQMEILPDVMCIEKKTCTLLYFREICIPVILKSKGYYSL